MKVMPGFFFYLNPQKITVTVACLLQMLYVARSIMNSKFQLFQFQLFSIITFDRFIIYYTCSTDKHNKKPMDHSAHLSNKCHNSD